MRGSVFGRLLCFGLLTLFMTSIATEAGARAYQIDLCSRKTGKRTRVTVLKSMTNAQEVARTIPGQLLLSHRLLRLSRDRVGGLPNRFLAHLEPVSGAPKPKLDNGGQRQPL